MVYVLSHTGNPLMPTIDHRKVRLLLQDGKSHYRKLKPPDKRKNLPTERRVAAPPMTEVTGIRRHIP